MQAQLVEDALRRPDLGLAAVDQHEVGHGPAALLGGALIARPGGAEPAAEHLAVRGDVVRAVDRADAEAPVLPGSRLAVLEHDHARDRLAALEVRDVIALDPARETRQRE